MNALFWCHVRVSDMQDFYGETYISLYLPMVTAKESKSI